MARIETGLGLIDIFQPRIEGFELTHIRISQPNLSVIFCNDLYLRGLFINPQDLTVWVCYGQPDKEANLQTFSLRYKPTTVKLTYQDSSYHHYTIKINPMLSRLT